MVVVVAHALLLLFYDYLNLYHRISTYRPIHQGVVTAITKDQGCSVQCIVLVELLAVVLLLQIFVGEGEVFYLGSQLVYLILVVFVDRFDVGVVSLLHLGVVALYLSLQGFHLFPQSLHLLTL